MDPSVDTLDDTRKKFIDAIRIPLTSFGDGYKCSICMDLYDNAVMFPCTHSMCSTCAEDWLKTKAECPVCKLSHNVSRRSLKTNDNVRAIVSAFKDISEAFQLSGYVDLTEAQIKASKPASEASRSNDLNNSRQRGNGNFFGPSEVVKPANIVGAGGKIKNNPSSGRKCKSTSPANTASSSSSSASTSTSSKPKVGQNKRGRSASPPRMAPPSSIAKSNTRKLKKPPPLRASSSSSSSSASSSSSFFSSSGTVSKSRLRAVAPEVGEIIAVTSLDDVASIQQFGVGFEDNPITVGEVVDVMGRHWPGINKEGGRAWVLKVNTKEDGTVSVDVNMLLGSTKYKDLSIDYIKRPVESFNMQSRSSRSGRNSSPSRSPVRSATPRSSSPCSTGTKSLMKNIDETVKPTTTAASSTGVVADSERNNKMFDVDGGIQNLSGNPTLLKMGEGARVMNDEQKIKSSIQNEGEEDNDDDEDESESECVLDIHEKKRKPDTSPNDEQAEAPEKNLLPSAMAEKNFNENMSPRDLPSTTSTNRSYNQLDKETSHDIEKDDIQGLRDDGLGVDIPHDVVVRDEIVGDTQEETNPSTLIDTDESSQDHGEVVPQTNTTAVSEQVVVIRKNASGSEEGDSEGVNKINAITTQEQEEEEDAEEETHLDMVETPNVQDSDHHSLLLLNRNDTNNEEEDIAQCGEDDDDDSATQQTLIRRRSSLMETSQMSFKEESSGSLLNIREGESDVLQLAEATSPQESEVVKKTLLNNCLLVQDKEDGREGVDREKEEEEEEYRPLNIKKRRKPVLDSCESDNLEDTMCDSNTKNKEEEEEEEGSIGRLSVEKGNKSRHQKDKEVDTTNEEVQDSASVVDSSNGAKEKSTAVISVNIKTRKEQSDEKVEEEEEEEEVCLFEVGCEVDVKPRLGPGFNKPGGCARVVSYDKMKKTYHVKYILGGSDTSVPSSLLTAIEHSSLESDAELDFDIKDGEQTSRQLLGRGSKGSPTSFSSSSILPKRKKRTPRKKQQPTDYGFELAIQHAIQLSKQQQFVNKAASMAAATPNTMVPPSSDKAAKSATVIVSKNAIGGDHGSSSNNSYKRSGDHVKSDVQDSASFNIFADDSYVDKEDDDEDYSPVLLSKRKKTKTNSRGNKSAENKQISSDYDVFALSNSSSFSQDASEKTSAKNINLKTKSSSNEKKPGRKQSKPKKNTSLISSSSSASSSLTKKFVISFSNFPVEETEKMKRKLERLSNVDISYEEDIELVTHLVVKTRAKEPKIADKRTLKYMGALLRGIWIVNVEWVNACCLHSKTVDEVQYEILKDAKERTKIVDGPRKSRIDKSQVLINAKSSSHKTVVSAGNSLFSFERVNRKDKYLFVIPRIWWNDTKNKDPEQDTASCSNSRPIPHKKIIKLIPAGDGILIDDKFEDEELMLCLDTFDSGALLNRVPSLSSTSMHQGKQDVAFTKELSSSSSSSSSHSNISHKRLKVNKENLHNVKSGCHEVNDDNSICDAENTRSRDMFPAPPIRKSGTRKDEMINSLCHMIYSVYHCSNPSLKHVAKPSLHNPNQLSLSSATTHYPVKLVFIFDDVCKFHASNSHWALPPNELQDCLVKALEKTERIISSASYTYPSSSRITSSTTPPTLASKISVEMLPLNWMLDSISNYRLLPTNNYIERQRL